jgi:hypothetical protein
MRLFYADRSAIRFPRLVCGFYEPRMMIELGMTWVNPVARLDRCNLRALIAHIAGHTRLVSKLIGYGCGCNDTQTLLYQKK